MQRVTFSLRVLVLAAALAIIPNLAAAQTPPSPARPSARHCVASGEMAYRGALMPWLKYSPNDNQCVDTASAPSAIDEAWLASHAATTSQPMYRSRVTSYESSQNGERMFLGPLAGLGIGLVGAGVGVVAILYGMAESGSFCSSGLECGVIFGIGAGLGYAIGNVMGVQMVSERMGGGGHVGGAIFGEILGAAVGTTLIAATGDPWMIIPALLLPPLGAAIGSEIEIASRSRRDGSTASRDSHATTARLSPSVTPWSSQGHVTGATMGLTLTAF